MSRFVMIFAGLTLVDDEPAIDDVDGSRAFEGCGEVSFDEDNRLSIGGEIAKKTTAVKPNRQA